MNIKPLKVGQTSIELRNNLTGMVSPREGHPSIISNLVTVSLSFYFDFYFISFILNQNLFQEKKKSLFFVFFKKNTFICI